MFDEVIAKLERWGHEFVLLLPNLGVAAAVVVATWLVSILVGKAVSRVMSRVSDHRALNDLVRKLARLAVMAAGLLIALNVMQLEDAAATFLAGAGIAGIALGFAFQDLSANFIAGVAMAVRRPISVGELVETNDHLGIVDRIELRSTWLETLDGKLVMIPNRKVFENVVVNHSRLGYRRVEIPVGVSYDADLSAVRAAVTTAISGVSPRLDRPIEVLFEKFGESSIDFIVRFWVKFRVQTDYLVAKSDALVAIRAAFEAQKITIPFPIRTLDFDKDARQALRGLSS